MILTRGGLVLLLCTAVSLPVAAEEPKLTKAEVAKKAKPAVAFVMAKVEIKGRPVTSQGSAFCVHSSGLFVTNAHVVKDSAEIELVVNPSQKDQKVFKATVIRTAERDDLALLKVETKDALPTLTLGEDSALEELIDVVACGYPFGSALTFDSKDYPSVTTTAGAISSLRKKGGELELIQLDVSLNPGNSGGPVLGLDGKVIGVALGGIKGTQLNFAIPARRVSALLARPEFAFTAPSLQPADRGKAIPVEARLATFAPADGEVEVELEVRRGAAAPSRHPMKLEKGVYRVDVVLIPERKDASACSVEASFAEGSLSARVEDRVVKIGAASHKLSEFKTLSPAKEQAVLRSGARLEGKITGLESVPITLGGKAITYDLSTAQEIVAQVSADEPVIVLEVAARRGGKELGRISRSVIVGDPDKVYLADLQPSATKPGPWPLGVGTTGSPDHSTPPPIKVKGVAYPKGLGLHANNPPATVSYRPAKTASAFRATVAYNDDNDGKVSGPCHFEVYGNGKLLWKSKAITTYKQTEECVVDVTGVEVLELRTSLNGSGFGAHAVWLDPILVGPDSSAIHKAAGKK
jgi:S1-C subfamily serine protease